jgi:hypothetical protein
MKMNWGWGITLFLIGFVTFMGYLTYRAFQIDFDLVADDYYNQELHYGERIQATNNAHALSAQIAVVVGETHVSIQLPLEHHLGTVGEAHFYSPVDKESDRLYTLALNDQGEMLVPLDALPAQRYLVKVSWKHGEHNFFGQEDIEILP